MKILNWIIIFLIIKNACFRSNCAIKSWKVADSILLISITIFQGDLRATIPIIGTTCRELIHCVLNRKSRAMLLFFFSKRKRVADVCCFRTIFMKLIVHCHLNYILYVIGNKRTNIAALSYTYIL